MQKHCRIEFGAYAQVFDDHDPTNTMQDRTDGCVCLGPVDNLQGSVRFLRLRTGNVITCRQFTMLPITREVITRVNEMGEHEGVPRYLTFADVQDDPNDEYEPEEDDIDSEFDPDDYTTDPDLEENDEDDHTLPSMNQHVITGVDIDNETEDERIEAPQTQIINDSQDSAQNGGQGDLVQDLEEADPNIGGFLEERNTQGE